VPIIYFTTHEGKPPVTFTYMAASDDNIIS